MVHSPVKEKQESLPISYTFTGKICTVYLWEIFIIHKTENGKMAQSKDPTFREAGVRIPGGPNPNQNMSLQQVRMEDRASLGNTVK